MARSFSALHALSREIVRVTPAYLDEIYMKGSSGLPEWPLSVGRWPAFGASRNVDAEVTRLALNIAKRGIS